jgi:CBS domain containing-hemolysin-like protein
VSSTDVAMIVAIVVLILVATFLSVAETALTRITPHRAAGLRDENRFGGTDLAWLVERPEMWLNSLLLTVLVCQLVQATLTGIVADRLFGVWGVALATFVNVVLVFVIAEAAPKTWAIQHTDRAALLAAKPVRAIALFPPLRLLSRGLIGLTNVILPGKGLKKGPYVTEEELLALAEAAVEESVLKEEERELIASIIEFGDTVVREVMVPRPDMITVDADFRIGDALEVMLLNGYSRIPVCGQGIDDIVGVIFAKDLMRIDRDGRGDQPVTACMRPPTFVPESKRVADLLPEMQRQQVHLAVVVDEYGGTAGLVTLEDLLEELVGEIRDEFDTEEAMVEPLGEGVLVANARMPVDELNDLLDTPLPTGDWDSVGGLMFHLLGHVPHEGETIDTDGYQLRAEQVQGRRIGRVRVVPASAADPDAGHGSDAEAHRGADDASASVGRERR